MWGALAGGAALALTLVPPVTAAAAERDTSDITFAFVNDFHGRIDENTVKWAGTIEQIRAAGGADNTLFVSAGDNFGNSLYASSVQGDTPTIDVLNALDLDASAVGNNELFIGYDQFTKLAHEARFPFLAANMVNGSTGELETGAYSVHTVDGLRVAIIGVTTPDTHVQFPAGDPKFLATIDTLNRTAEEIEHHDLADLTVAVVHDGGGLQSPPATVDDELAQGGVLANLMTQTSPLVDALFTGHTHAQYVYQAPVPGSSEQTRPVIQTGSFGQMIGKVTLRYDRGSQTVISSTAELVPRSTVPDTVLVSQFPRVAAVERIVDEALLHAETTGNTSAGRATAPITTAFSGGQVIDGRYTGGLTGQRTLESALGTLVANMFRDVQQDQEVPPQIGLSLPNFIRSDLLPDAAGDVPVRQIIDTFGIRDRITSADITGAQLKRLLEQQWQRTAQGEAQGYVQLALSDNLTYTYDDGRPEGDRITSITVDGEAVDAAQRYRVGLTGGILLGLVNFHEGSTLTNVTDSGMLDVEGFQQYFAALSAQTPIAPSFVKHGVKFVAAERSASLLAGAEVAAGRTLEFDISELDLTSTGAPENTRLNVVVNDTELGSVNIVDGAARVTVEVSEALAGTNVVLKLGAEPSGTVVTRHFRGAREAPDGEQEPDPGQKPDPDRTPAPDSKYDQTVRPPGVPGPDAPSADAGDLAATGSQLFGLLACGGVALGAGCALLVSRRALRKLHRGVEP